MPRCVVVLAQVYVTNSEIVVDEPELVKGKRVVLIEDGPTLTHGGMSYGAGKASRRTAGGGGDAS
jgi:predicted GTPase